MEVSINRVTELDKPYEPQPTDSKGSAETNPDPEYGRTDSSASDENCDQTFSEESASAESSSLSGRLKSIEEKFQYANDILLRIEKDYQDTIVEQRKELTEFKTDLYQSILSKALNEMIDIHRDMTIQLSKKGDDDHIPVSDLRDYAERIEDMLWEYDIESYHSSEKMPLDGKIHKVIKRIETNDPELKSAHRTIAKSYRSGYRKRGTNGENTGKILQQEQVAVYIYIP